MIHQRFSNVLGQPTIIGKIDIALLKEKFEQQLSHFEDSAVLLDYLEHYGEAVYQEGFFAFINPMDYEIPLKKFPKLKAQSILPFAKTAMGNFYLIGEVDDEVCLAYYKFIQKNINMLIMSSRYFLQHWLEINIIVRQRHMD